MRITTLLIAIAALFSITSCASVTKPSPVPPPPIYRIKSPDSLLIRVRPDPSINQQVRVRPDGHIHLDLVGDVYVEGLTPMEVSRLLADKLGAYVKEPFVNVSLSNADSHVFYVFGEVPRIGRFPYTNQLTVLDAVARAGGYTRRSMISRTYIIRPEQGDKEAEIIRVNLNRVIFRGDQSINHFIQPNDVVYIPPDPFARVGYAIEKVLFPVTSLLAAGGQAAFINEQIGLTGNNDFSGFGGGSSAPGISANLLTSFLAGPVGAP